MDDSSADSIGKQSDINKLNWQSRELSLRIKALESQILSAKQGKESILEKCKSVRESIRVMLDERQVRQKSSLEILLINKRESLETLCEKLDHIKSQTLIRRKNMLQDLCEIYPIIEFPDRKGYSICDIHLPNINNFEGHDETMVSVAIGYVCHLLLLLSEFLDITLTFPLKYYGSKSSIYCSGRSQTFPLFIESFKSRDWINFSQGVNLLNMDIVQIRTLCGLGTKDPEETLANLHDLKVVIGKLDLVMDLNIELC